DNIFSTKLEKLVESYFKMYQVEPNYLRLIKELEDYVAQNKRSYFLINYQFIFKALELKLADFKSAYIKILQETKESKG
ncbi:hypothetical protein, partial [Romboutsia sp.]|uniref:hypothetical protein n=1 Tax=Romboutsia sp. TaxID=1965302 RepID=UPI003F2D160E